MNSPPFQVDRHGSFAWTIPLKGLVCLAACVLSLAHAGGQTWTADNGNGTFTNPLFFDEFSDPDLIRVGKDFYLTGTTMHAMPGLAVLHSRDLVNWDFESYALDQLDLGPAYRLEHGQNIYGQGIWAPCLRYHRGTFYIFSNVNGETTQLFRASGAKGPWTRTPMKRSFHDLSVLFEDDNHAYIVWGYQEIHLAQLTPDLTDIVPGSERLIFHRGDGIGEGLHLYRAKGFYYLTSAWYLGVMHMPVARATHLDGPWEVNEKVSSGEQFGTVLGYRLSSFRPPLDSPKPYTELPPDPSAIGRLAMHQGGIVDTPTGEWWGFSMFEGNALGRLTALSPITWKDGWPYFGLTGNLGRTPRTWIKPHTGTTEKPHAPYVRSDQFSARSLQPIWQWNHVPVANRWSLAARPGFLRLHALMATSLWDARDTLTQRAIGPISIPTVKLDGAGMQDGDVAGLALLIQPEAWLGLRKRKDNLELVQFDGQTQQEARVPLTSAQVWLRVSCDYRTQLATFSYSTDGSTYQDIGSPFRTVTIGVTFQGVRYSLFAYNTLTNHGGYADFDFFDLREPEPHGLTRAIPYNREIELANAPVGATRNGGDASLTNSGPGSYTVLNRGLGRVALRSEGRLLSVSTDGTVTLQHASAADAETFQWIETFTGELTLLSLRTHRYLALDAQSGRLNANSPGPEPDNRYQDQFRWTVVTPNSIPGSQK